MKRLLVVIEGLADETSEDLGGKTPLEAAKTPAMDLIASQGKIAQALFVPSALKASSDVAFFSILGINPVKSYTAIAPLDAVASGIKIQSDAMYSRCDLVTVSDGKLMDPQGGFVSSKESQALLESMAAADEAKGVDFFIHHDNQHIVSGEAVSAMFKEVSELSSPELMTGQSVSKYLAQLKSSPAARQLVERSLNILEAHEVNKVRVDLGENPANMIWLWGQGKCPKIDSFEARYGMSAGVVTNQSFLKGLGALMGMTHYDDVQKALAEKDFVLVFLCRDNKQKNEDAKCKLRRIEEADRLIGKFREILAMFPLHKIAVTGDMPYLSAHCKNVHGQVPLAFCGAGVASSNAIAFDEKAAMNSSMLYEQGVDFLPYFLNS